MKMQADAVSYGALGRWEAQRSKLEYAGHDLLPPICVYSVPREYAVKGELVLGIGTHEPFLARTA